MIYNVFFHEYKLLFRGDFALKAENVAIDRRWVDHKNINNTNVLIKHILSGVSPPSARPVWGAAGGES